MFWFFPRKKKYRYDYQMMVLIIFALFLALLLGVVFLTKKNSVGDIGSYKESAVELTKPAAKVEYKFSSSLLSPGSYNVKVIEDLQIQSNESFNATPMIYDVVMDIHYPQAVNPATDYAFPLVIITHPTVTLTMAPARKQFDYIADHLASHGYVVAIYEWSKDLGQCDIFRNAEREDNIVNYLVAENNDVRSPFYGLIDTNNVGLIGHSNGAASKHFGKVSNRVRAYVSLSGLLCEWGGLYRDIVALDKPMMYIGATNDQLRANTTRFQFYGYWNKHSGPKIMMDVNGGDHWQFTDDYEYYPDVLKEYSKNDTLFQRLLEICTEVMNDGNRTNDARCQFPTIAREAQHAVVKYFVLAYFNAYLKNNRAFISDIMQPEIAELIKSFQFANL